MAGITDTSGELKEKLNISRGWIAELEYRLNTEASVEIECRVNTDTSSELEQKLNISRDQAPVKVTQQERLDSNRC